MERKEEVEMIELHVRHWLYRKMTQDQTLTFLMVP